MPERIRLRRTKGWRKPEGAVVVSRPTKWGNPFSWKALLAERSPQEAREEAWQQYADWLMGKMPGVFPERRKAVFEGLGDLLGTDLCCWCGPRERCHADLLLELANHNLVAGRPPLVSYTMTIPRGRGTTSYQEYPLGLARGCKTARYVGGTSIYLCECRPPNNCPGVIEAAWRECVRQAVERLKQR